MSSEILQWWATRCLLYFYQGLRLHVGPVGTWLETRLGSASMSQNSEYSSSHHPFMSRWWHFFLFFFVKVELLVGWYAGRSDCKAGNSLIRNIGRAFVLQIKVWPWSDDVGLAAGIRKTITESAEKEVIKSDQPPCGPTWPPIKGWILYILGINWGSMK